MEIWTPRTVVEPVRMHISIGSKKRERLASIFFNHFLKLSSLLSFPRNDIGSLAWRARVRSHTNPILISMAAVNEIGHEPQVTS